MHNQVLLLTAFGLFICGQRLYAQANAALTAQQHYDRGRELQAAGRQGEAISAFESAIRSDRNLASAHHQLGSFGAERVSVVDHEVRHVGGAQIL